MDLETYLLLERKNLIVERERLNAARVTEHKNIETAMKEECPAEVMIRNGNLRNQKCRYQPRGETNNEIEMAEEDATMSSNNLSSPQDITLTKSSRHINKTETEHVDVHENSAEGVEIAKINKEWANQIESKVATSSQLEDGEHQPRERPPSRRRNRHRNEDDMEQWVSDTFYSYFPGYNNEYQKRQNYLRDRQRENQQNFLRHQMLNPPPSHSNAAHRAKQGNMKNVNVNVNTARSSSSTNTSNTTTDKTDLEIIVNNPDYVPPKYVSVRPGTTRHKLLQELRHTDLSPYPFEDSVAERKRRTAELESARKKEYQRELMQQIEEKRRSLEVLKEKERHQEEVLTRRLQEQLKTIKLEEQLEKERLRVEKLRFDSEQNRLMREHLLSKLENDKKLLYANRNAELKTKDDHVAPGTSKSAEDSNSSNDRDQNKVYKYFSNSARHEYRRGRSLPLVVDFDLDLPEVSNSERECFHISEKVCPMCDAPLKNYESCCLRCQKKLSLKIHRRHRDEAATNSNGSDLDRNNKNDEKSKRKNGKAFVSRNDKENVSKRGNGNENDEEEELEEEHENDHDGDDENNNEGVCNGDGEDQSFALVCHKCERMYSLCPNCVAKRAVCRACHRKLNVCMNCRRSLCTYCLEEIATGRDIEHTHVNERDEVRGTSLKTQPSADITSERSFKVLEVNYAPNKESDDGDLSSPTLPSAYANNVSYKQIQNNLHSDDERPPYSMNIERNSIFHPDYEPSFVQKQNDIFAQKVIDKSLIFDADSSQTDDGANMERIRKETDKRLSRYVKNYGDLALYERSKSESRNRSTQTTPDGLGRRDIVLHEEHNLSMPLLREMPKITRKESMNMMEKASNNHRKIDNLKRKWEIPAVQKFTISSTSPRVLTQVGAIRKQLQAELLRGDEGDEGDEDDIY